MRALLRYLAPPALLLFVFVILAPLTSGAGARGETAQASAAGSVPPAGGVTTTVATSANVDALLTSIPFNVSSMFLFNVTSQYWMSYTPGAPAWLNESFTEHIDRGAIVWVRRAPSDNRGGVSWNAPSELVALNQAQTLPVPPAGRVTAGAAGTTSVDQLVAAQDFEVRGVFAFDVAQQRFVSYVPGVPAWANSLSANGLQPSGVVWISRNRGDQSATVATVDSLAAIGSLTSPATTPPVGVPGSPTVSTPPVPGASPASTPAPKPTATPKPGATATPTPTATTPPAAAANAPAPAGAPGMVSGAALIRHLTFEDGEAAMTSEQAPPGGIGRTKETARAGSSAGYALLKPGDERSFAGGYRAEWHGDDHAGKGTERWHGISYFFPSDYNQGSNSATWNDRLIFQFADQGSPMFSLHLDVDREQLWVRRKLPNRDSNGNPQFETLGRWDFKPGQWYDVVFHVKWTTDNSGFFDVYFNGERKVAYQGRTLAERDVTYSKWGIYGQPTHLLFDEVWTAEGPGTLESVRP
ncbi:MAG: heparin lyase I family protein [Dehalococcoidia bacterium]|nr:heparin lyase I family protein [Dehalococcoidia bacterium]MCB9491220.1 heparin lyase I family protein [Dehalococcoidia bacterium]